MKTQFGKKILRQSNIKPWRINNRKQGEWGGRGGGSLEYSTLHSIKPNTNLKKLNNSPQRFPLFQQMTYSSKISLLYSSLLSHSLTYLRACLPIKHRFMKFFSLPSTPHIFLMKTFQPKLSFEFSLFFNSSPPLSLFSFSLF